MFNHRLAEKLKSIVNSDGVCFRLNKSLSVFCNDYNFRNIKGKSVYISDEEKAQIKNLLEVKGYTIDASINKSMSRSDKLAYGPNEKAGGGRLKRNRVSIKSSGYLPILLNNQSLQLPPMSHLDIDISQIHSNQHNCLILVENYENFNRFCEAEIHLPSHLDNPLVIYRGDKNESRLDDVMSYINTSKLPVIAAVDIDPYGLLNIARINGLVGVLAPSHDDLIALLSSRKTSRPNLYESHYLGCNAALDALPENHVCKILWTMIKAKKAGVVQEQFIRLKLPLVLWPLTEYPHIN